MKYIIVCYFLMCFCMMLYLYILPHYREQESSVEIKYLYGGSQIFGTLLVLSIGLIPLFDEYLFSIIVSLFMSNMILFYLNRWISWFNGNWMALSYFVVFTIYFLLSRSTSTIPITGFVAGILGLVVVKLFVRRFEPNLLQKKRSI